METPNVINSKYIIIVTIDLEGNTIKLRGKIVHTRKSDPSGVALTGIQFLEPYDTQREIIARFIRAHYYRGKQPSS